MQAKEGGDPLLGKRIQQKRMELGISREELAEKVGTSEAMIRHFESGVKVPSLAMMMDLARALQTGLDELCRDE